MDLVSLLVACAAGLPAPAVDQEPGQFDSVQIDGTIEISDPVQAPGEQLPTQSDIDQWQPLIDEASRRFGVPAAWIRAVMQAESGGRTMLDGRPITSRTGAMGLMQMMPGTYEEMRQRYGLGPDPHDPRDNMLAGAAYLREMYDRYGYPGLFAAYNAGPERFDEYLLNGRPLPAETRRYLAALTVASSDIPMRLQWPSGRELFFKLRMPLLDAQPLSLFVPLSKDRLAPSR
jgi:hypothetical protein